MYFIQPNTLLLCIFKKKIWAATAFDIFILDAAGMKIHLAGIKTRSQRKNGLPSSYVDVCNMETAGMKTCSGDRKNVLVGLQRG